MPRLSSVSKPCAPPSSLPDCPAGITLITAWSLPNCATCVPGWRPCGSTLEVASYQPLRYAVHGACLSESMRAMIAIVHHAIHPYLAHSHTERKHQGLD